MPDIIEDMLHVDMKELKAGTPFPEAAEEFLAWCGEDFIFCSWGSLDLLELQRNMKYYQMPALAAGPICFLDIQKLFGIAFEHKKVGRTLEYAVDSLQIEKISRSTGHSVMLIIRRLYCRKYRRISRNIVPMIPTSFQRAKRGDP